jgi:hypothetical protein
MGTVFELILKSENRESPRRERPQLPRVWKAKFIRGTGSIW